MGKMEEEEREKKEQKRRGTSSLFRRIENHQNLVPFDKGGETSGNYRRSFC